MGVKMEVLQPSGCTEQVDVDHFLAINIMKKDCKNYREIKTAYNFLFVVGNDRAFWRKHHGANSEPPFFF